MKRRRIVMLCTLFIALPHVDWVLGQAHPRAAEPETLEYRERADKYINDFARILTNDEASVILGRLEKVHRATGIEIVLVTIPSLAEFATPNFHAYATELLDRWEVGDNDEKGGILIQYSAWPREVQIVTRAGELERYHDDFQRVVKRKMLPYIHKRDSPRGLYEGVLGVIDVVTPRTWLSIYKWHLLGAALAVVTICAGISVATTGTKGWGTAFFIGAGTFIMYSLALLLGRAGSQGRRMGGRASHGRWRAKR